MSDINNNIIPFGGHSFVKAALLFFLLYHTIRLKEFQIVSNQAKEVTNHYLCCKSLTGWTEKWSKILDSPQVFTGGGDGGGIEILF